MKKSIQILLLIIPFLGYSQIPPGYYNTATGTGYTLKTQLHNIIKNHTEISYGDLWIEYENTDIDPNDGYIWDMYSENPTGTDSYNFTYSNDQCGSYSGESDCYNREHSFPKSWFNDASPMYTDIFHVVPTDGWVNGKRSNYPFGETSSPSWTSLNGSKLGSARSGLGYSGTIFEPIDEYKGDFARIYFYMATRYQDVLSTWPGSDMLDGSSDKVFTDWALNMLKTWHENDPVSQKEIDRNNYIYYNIQDNRNPYVDNINYVNLVWGGEVDTTYCQAPISKTICNGEVFNWNEKNLITAGQYKDTIPGVSCDTIYTLTLTVTTVNTTIQNQDNVIEANQNNAQYQWLDCANNYTILDDETFQSVTIRESGSYAVEISLNGCKDTSECVDIQVLSIDKTNNNYVNIYPNPTTGLININSNQQILNCEIYNIQGKKIKTYNSNTLNISILNKGVYILKIITDESSYSEKIILK